MAQGILLDSSQLLEVTFHENRYRVVYGFHTFQNFHKDDLPTLRASIMQLLTMGVGKTRLAREFKITRNTLDKWETIYQQEGLSGLVTMKNGRTQKCDEIIEKYILDLHAKLNKRKGHRETIIKEVKTLFGITVSRELIRRVLDKHKNPEETQKEIKEEVEPIEDEKSTDVKNGGVLLVLPFLENHNISALIPTEKEKDSKSYSFKDIVMTISMLLTGGLLKNEEQIKINDSPCMGAILREKLLPSLRTIRRKVPALIDKVDVAKLKKVFAESFFKLYIDRTIFYIDGHFMPYFGKEKILYGYNSLRRMAMKGRTSYVVHSDGGRPIFQILSDNFDNFNDNIKKTIGFLKELGCKKDMLLVFDRGGFGENFFKSIYQETVFICWSKGKTSPPRNGKWKKITRYVESNIYGKKKGEILEVKEEVNKDEKFKLRNIFIKKGDKISTAVTNDLARPLEELVAILTRRWGAQENVFKELKKIGYDNIHSYWNEEYSKGILLESDIDITKEMINPEYQSAVDERIKLKNRLKDLSAKIGKYSLMGKNIDMPTKRMDNLKSEIEEIEKKIGNVNKRMNYLPEKILRFDYIKENAILKLCSDKKEYFDLMKFISYNVKRDIADIVGTVYKDNRDIHVTIAKWLKSKCILQKVNGELIATFSCPSKKNEEESFRLLCEHLNSLNYRHFNTGAIMRFRVA